MLGGADNWGRDKTVLLVCRGLGEIHFLQRFQPQPDCRYIVASDNLRVHLEMKNYPWVAVVRYLEQMESFYVVAADVINYIELLNQWMESIGNDPKGIRQELLFWIRSCEGGKTSQRIQDLRSAIETVVYSIDKSETLIARELARLNLFSWEACAQQTNAVYTSLW